MNALVEGGGETFGEFLCTDGDESQAAEILGVAAAHVDLQERRCGQEECYAVFTHEWTDGFCIEGIRVKHDANAEDTRQRQCPGKTERMKKGQHTEHSIFRAEAKYLAKLFDVRADVVVRGHDAFGFTGAAAGEDDGGKAIEFLPYLAPALSPLRGEGVALSDLDVSLFR